MRKRSTRILALLLTVVMLISSSCITAFAKMDQYEEPQIRDKTGKPYFNYSQAGTWLMDTLDDLLCTINNGEKVFYYKVPILGYEINIDIHSYEALCSSISGTWDDIDGIAGLIGDLDQLNASALKNAPKRDNAQLWDYNCLYAVIRFLYDNRDKVLGNILNGDFNWSALLSGVFYGLITRDINGEEIGLFENPTLWLENFLYCTLEDLTGKEEGEYNAGGTDVDGSLQDLIGWLLGDLLGLENLDTSKFNLTTTPTYETINYIIQALLDQLVVPLLTDVIMDACDIEATDEFPYGPASEANNSTLVTVLGVVQGLMSEAENFPDYSSCQYPGEKIETLLKWFFLEGGMDQYISITINGISLEDGFVDLLNKLCRLAIPLVYGLGFDSLPKSLLYTQEELNVEPGQPGYIPNSACYAQLVELLLSKITRGYYINKNADSIAEVGSYALASLLARILPEYDYVDMLDANYEGGTKETYDGRTVSAMPFISDYTMVGQKTSASSSTGWVDVTRTYKIPYAALDMGVTIGVFFLDGLLNCDFSGIKDSVARIGVDPADTASATERFEQFLKCLADWGVDQYLPMFKTTYNLEKYNTPASVYKELDEVLFGLLPSSWLPSYVVDHTMEPGVNDTLGLSGNPQIPMESTADLIVGWLVGSVLDFDLQQLFGLFSANDPVNRTGELWQPLLKVLLRVIDRVFYIILGKYCICPSVGTRDAYNVPTTLTGLSSGSSPLLASPNIGNLINYLCYALGGKKSSFDATVVLEPLLSTVLPLIMSLEYVKPFRDASTSSGGILTQGQISVGELENFIKDIASENTYMTDYTEVYADETTAGSFYTLALTPDSTGNIVVSATAKTLPDDYVEGTTYYTQNFRQATDVDRFTITTNDNKVYTRVDNYEAVTLDGTNFEPGENYYSTEFVVADVDATTNGTYYTSQSESSKVYLPDSYNASATYYTHNLVSIGANETGNYLKLVTAYNPVELDGVGTNYNANKNYYKAVQSELNFGYLDAYNADTGLTAMGVYTSGSSASLGRGAYSTSINGQTCYIFREQEDFSSALASYNFYNDFLEDAEDFIGDYKNFILNDVPAAAAEWKEYLSGNSTSDAPESFYPWFVASGSYNNNDMVNMGLNGPFNEYQVIKDIRAIYGDSLFITSSTTNNTGATLVPIQKTAINHGYEVGNSDMMIAQYEGFKEWMELVEEYSNNLNNYYDGVNAYLSASEAGRKSYHDTCTEQLEWLLDYCEEAYNNGINSNGTGKAYTDRTYDVFKVAYKAGLDLISQVRANDASRRTTQSMVTYAREQLLEAFYALVEFGQVADLTQLNQYITIARRIRNSENALIAEGEPTYYEQTYNTLLSVLTTSENLANRIPGFDEQEDVDRQAARLYAAINGLAFLVAPALQVIDDYVLQEGEVPLAIPEEETWVDVRSNIVYGYIYGISEILGLNYNTDNDQRISPVGINKEDVSSHTTAYGNGTGTTIEGTSGGKTKFSYTAIVFGDINGDARIDGTDKNHIIAYATGSANSNLSEAQLIAADVNGDGQIDTTDASAIQMVIDYEATINQNAGITGTRVVETVA